MESFTNFIAESFDPKNTYKIISVEQTPDDEELRRIAGRDYIEKFQESPEDKSIELKFKSDNGTYFTVHYDTAWDAKRWDWELTFRNNRKDDGTYIRTLDIMGGFETKEVIKIFNTVIKTIHDLIHKKIEVNGIRRNYEVHSISFQAKVDEPSRVKLYKRMFKRFTAELNSLRTKTSVSEKPDKDNLISFKIEGTTAKERNEIRRKRREEKERKEKEEKDKKEKSEKKEEKK